MITVKCVDVHTPRTDNQPGVATNITPGKLYSVVEILTNNNRFMIINDQFKLARYSQHRFIVTNTNDDPSPVTNLDREQFNKLDIQQRKTIIETMKVWK